MNANTEMAYWGNKQNFRKPQEPGFALLDGETGTSYPWRPWRTNGSAVGTGGSSSFSDQG
jgi:hypothetical protein